MVCPNCFSPALNGPYSATNIASRRLIALMECSHCHCAFDPYERFGNQLTAKRTSSAA